MAGAIRTSFVVLVTFLSALIAVLIREPNPFDVPGYKNPPRHGADKHVWKNYDGSLSAKPSHFHEPASLDEIIQIVKSAAAKGEEVKVTGAGHSWSPIAVPSSNRTTHLLSLDNYNKILSVDKETHRVTVQGGIRLWDLNEQLWTKHSLALTNLGAIMGQSIAGAISTATHGTGLKAGSISASVVGLELVDGKGEVFKVSATENEELFQAARIHLGVLGIVSTVTLQAEPAFHLFKEEYGAPVEQIVTNVTDIITRNEHIQWWWLTHTDHARVFQFNRAVEAGEKHWVADFMDEKVTFHLLNGVLTLTSWFPKYTVKIFNGVLKPLMSDQKQWIERSYRVFSNVGYLNTYSEMEIFVPVNQHIPAFKALQKYVAEFNAKHTEFTTNLVISVRYVAADPTSLLSPCYDGACVALSTTVYKAPKEWRDKYYRGYQETLREFNGRPHWGKNNLVGPAEAEELYGSRWEQFKQVREKVDPEGVFLNEWGRKMFL